MYREVVHLDCGFAANTGRHWVCSLLCLFNLFESKTASLGKAHSVKAIVVPVDLTVYIGGMRPGLLLPSMGCLVAANVVLVGPAP